MNIWIINHYAIPINGSGGTRHAVLAKYLRESGHDVTIFASDTNEFKDADIKEKKYVDRTYDNQHFRYIYSPQYSNVFQRFYGMIEFRKNLLKSLEGLKRPDVVIGSCVHLHAADAGRIVAKKYRIPFVFEIRDIWPQTLVDIGALKKSNPVYWYLRNIELRCLRAADKIITLLPGAGDYAVEHGVNKNKVVCIPNGINKEYYPADIPPLPDSATFTAMFFGAHGPANGLETILKAAEILQKTKGGENINISFIGDGVRKPALMEMAKELNLTNVQFSEPVKKRELFKIAATANAFIFCLADMKVLREHGISANKLFDYLMCGRPVLFSCNSYNNPVDEAQAGISVPAQDPQKMADALIQLKNLSRDEQIAMGIRGRNWVLEHNEFEKLTAKLERELDKLVTKEKIAVLN